MTDKIRKLLRKYKFKPQGRRWILEFNINPTLTYNISIHQDMVAIHQSISDISLAKFEVNELSEKDKKKFLNWSVKMKKEFAKEGVIL